MIAQMLAHLGARKALALGRAAEILGQRLAQVALMAARSDRH
jgi:hypothetical protein